MTKMSQKDEVCIIACVYVQYVLSCSLNPFCRDRNMLEYKSFDSACAFKSKALHVCVRYETSVKVSFQSGQKQEHRVFRHERFAAPFLCNYGTYLKLITVYVFGLPSAQGKDIVIQRYTPVCADIKIQRLLIAISN